MKRKAAHGARAGADADGRHPRPEAAPRGLPARDVGRHGAARDDRDGARLRARAAHRRRADDGAGRDHPGPDPGPDAHAPAQETGTAIILITHDLGVVAEMCDRVAVMYAGEIVEQTDVRTLFRDPKHPYTVGLIGSVPVPGRSSGRALHHPGQRAQPHRAARGLSLRAALHGTRRARQRAGDRAASRAAARPLRATTSAAGCTTWPTAARDRQRITSPRRPTTRGGGCRHVSLARLESDVRPVTGGDARPRRPAARRASELAKVFPIKGGMLQRTVAEVRAVDGVDLRINRGETLGLVGESGCGKTTVGRLLLRLIDVRPDGSSSTARTSPRSRAARCGRIGAACRSSSRTRTRRWTRARRSATASVRAFASTASARAPNVASGSRG